ncbi:MAG TPA: Asp-tRNA(Asn)/Glu-tRNA(Gln) amidotransferase subunit GatA [Clostridiales bacterium]|nr:Asp-tRNA(Asn)/Glu-tRNA(Gln) amidotransferase subunit GatA [Clostridiales bacterium]
MGIEKYTVKELSEKLQNKEISSVEVTRAFLDRIKKYDPIINSYITVCEERALEAAEEADRRIAEGERGGLLGIPVGIKDNICTEGITTTCASKMLYNFVPPYDATVIKKLKAAGAVIVGKLNMDEFAMGSSTETSYFKKTKNPYDTSLVPGGSSGGSAAAVSANLAAFTLGSDTGGSIRQPAAFCGSVGLKPTYGLVSRFGLIAFASSLDQIGPLTKTVEDCALVLKYIAGHDKLDSTSVNIPIPDYTSALGGDIAGMRIGVPREYLEDGIQPEIKKAVLDAVKIYESLGAACEECSLPLTKYALYAYYIISSAEASSNLARYDGVKYGFRAENYKGLNDMYLETRSQGFGEEVKRRIMLGTFALSSGYYDAYYKKAQQVRTLIRKDFSNSFAKFDALLTPTTPTTAFRFGEKADPISMYMGDVCTVAVNIAGLPAISMPAGLDSAKRPIGIQLIADSFNEEKLLSLAYAYEKTTGYENLRPDLKEGA